MCRYPTKMLRAVLSRAGAGGGGGGGRSGRAIEKHLVQATFLSSSFPSLPVPIPIHSSETLVSSIRDSLSLSYSSFTFLPQFLRCFRSVHGTSPSILHRRTNPSSFRVFSSVSPGQEVERKKAPPIPQQQQVPVGVVCSEDDDHLVKIQIEKQSRFIPIKAYFLCTGIDLKGLQRSSINVTPLTSRPTNYVVLKFCKLESEDEFVGLETGLAHENNFCYMMAFQYGAVVLFNVTDYEVDRYLQLVKTYASGMLPDMRKDEYAVVEKLTLETWMQGGLDYIMLKKLDVDGIRTIGRVLGQSIALDYYDQQVDDMVAEFKDIARGMEDTGTFTTQRKKLFQSLGKVDSNLADVILKLGLFQRTGIAWESANYSQIWEYLRDEYELTQRFDSLDFKLKFVERKIHFLEENLHNRKSYFLELLIVILIGTDILISVYNHSSKVM